MANIELDSPSSVVRKIIEGVVYKRNEFDGSCDPFHTGDDEIDAIPPEQPSVVRQAVISGIKTSEDGVILVNLSGEIINGARKPSGRRHFQVIYDSGLGETEGRLVGIGEAVETPEQISLKESRVLAPKNVQKARELEIRRSKKKRKVKIIPF